MAKRPYKEAVAVNAVGNIGKGFMEGIMLRKQLEDMVAERAIKSQMLQLQQEEAKRTDVRNRFDMDRALIDLERGTAVYGPNGEIQSVPGVRGASIDPATGAIIRGQGFSVGDKTVKSAPTNPALKAPAGYRYTATGNLEAIPGGPAEAKQAEKDAKKASIQNAAIVQSDRIISKVDQALGKVGPTSAGLGGRFLSSFPGSKAKNLATDIQTIKANLGFAELQAMRQSSPTGGALGQVAVQELDALQATIASLDQEQSPAQLSDRLKEIRGHYERWKQTLQQAQQQEVENEDSAALQWAASNPSDPRAKEIFRLHGNQ